VIRPVERRISRMFARKNPITYDNAQTKQFFRNTIFLINNFFTYEFSIHHHLAHFRSLLCFFVEDFTVVDCSSVNVSLFCFDVFADVHFWCKRLDGYSRAFASFYGYKIF
jgi:hypothetical protein